MWMPGREQRKFLIKSIVLEATHLLWVSIPSGKMSPSLSLEKIMFLNQVSMTSFFVRELLKEFTSSSTL